MKQFTDQSRATRVEKAKRVLWSLADGHDYKYFYGDGYPRHEELQQDAAAALEVLNELSASLPANTEAATALESNAPVGVEEVVDAVSSLGHAGDCRCYQFNDTATENDCDCGLTETKQLANALTQQPAACVGCEGIEDGVSRIESILHHAAAQATEIEALRVDVEAWKASHSMVTDTCHHFQARAERLEEALRDAKEKMLAQVKWVACDCGCDRDKPADAASVAWLRVADMLNRALLQEQEEGK